MRDPKATEKLAKAAASKAEEPKRGRIREVIDDLKALIRMLRAYAKGEYRGISWESLVLATAGVAYFVSPIDVIPDFLPGGLVDDAAVLAFVIALIAGELEDFQRWEAAQAK